MTQSECLERLGRLYLCMAAWNGDHFKDFDDDVREDFESAVKAGKLLPVVEEAKRDLLSSGYDAPDAWLREGSAAHFSANYRPSSEERSRLSAHFDQIHIAQLRIDFSPAEGERPGIDRESLAILNNLATRNALAIQDDIAAATTIGRKTVGKRLADLSDKGLVEQPGGVRAGWRITKSGRDAIA